MSFLFPLVLFLTLQPLVLLLLTYPSFGAVPYSSALGVAAPYPYSYSRGPTVVT
jgi:hypothetical protein